jgi:hypothetical protein
MRKIRPREKVICLGLRARTAETELESCPFVVASGRHFKKEEFFGKKGTGYP